MDNQFFAQQGWQCPICKRVYSPTTTMCYYCGNTETITSNTTTIKTGIEQGYCDTCKHNGGYPGLSICLECKNYDRYEKGGAV